MKIFYLALLILISCHAVCQVRELSLTGALGKNQQSASIAAGYDWELWKTKRFALGTGIRINTYFGRNQVYITAPAKLTSGSTGPLVIFKKNIAENIDTFRIHSPQVTSFNLFINLRYRIASKFLVGFNIDAMGFSVGSRKTGTYINKTESITQSEQSRPTVFNLLLISDNDRGSLNSELYLKYQVNESWAAKVAANFLFTEYTTDSHVQRVPEPNDRFRNKSLMFGFGLVRKF